MSHTDRYTCVVINLMQKLYARYWLSLIICNFETITFSTLRFLALINLHNTLLNYCTVVLWTIQINYTENAIELDNDFWNKFFLSYLIIKEFSCKRVIEIRFSINWKMLLSYFYYVIVLVRILAKYLEIYMNFFDVLQYYYFWNFAIYSLVNYHSYLKRPLTSWQRYIYVLSQLQQNSLAQNASEQNAALTLHHVVS